MEEKSKPSIEDLAAWLSGQIESACARPWMFAACPAELDGVLWCYHSVGQQLDPNRWRVREGRAASEQYEHARRSHSNYYTDQEATQALFDAVIAYWKE